MHVNPHTYTLPQAHQNGNVSMLTLSHKMTFGLVLVVGLLLFDDVWGFILFRLILLFVCVCDVMCVCVHSHHICMQAHVSSSAHVEDGAQRRVPSSLSALFSG